MGGTAENSLRPYRDGGFYFLRHFAMAENGESLPELDVAWNLT